ncbi:ubiquinol-cytochrome c reductase cytochrome b subunit [Arthrobacter sp. zg-Y820]|uniref:cytochrome bc1 complex cytochrome b subunit n=1 Tax=unclassified Arthrobacter TaxID=235627 RepID=UPI001E62D1B4|nr:MULTISPECIES: ubiquinol-cytochrome c reductase cytochrome b subunit [unclassified Arthrobacter]MCC9196500.1 ubiquinol-cytochrome c reductase cytochrome b subunit [Arthrobacter sp. zg-Y820]MDK1279362.1 ubiquinol-cytochrome c reductase cytochrome b subunit [Arthrobacter sp. zg.Y820]MDK1359018.1 ubiquinol-cytochrome c reductase cytochrome b subunit [Arthrobacter sp. zg-Y1219]WIB08253.1 ubiquinol-cytochrome c reductase cytochrome b subunit [Arthrobacter sp. zg-Y820]
MSVPSATPYEPKTRLGRVTNFVDSRVGGSAMVKEFGRKVFPDHWTFMFGEVALYCFVILLLSGTFLTFFFDPSMAETHYNGSYVPLKGVEMSVAYESSLNISFDIRGGLFMRQVHHWSALLFVAAVAVHMLRVFFTGAFRKPRELNWVVGGVLLILSLAAGFTGYSLPDDLLSGNGLRIIDGVMKAIPVVGTYLSFFLFGGEFPGTDIIGRLYMLHILLVPALILLMIAVHLFMVVVHKHTQFRGPGRTNNNVVGYPVGPVYAAKAGGFFFIVFGIIAIIAGLFTINPIWNYGPYDPSPVSAGTQPDWYIGWVDGALRLMPGWIGNIPMEWNIPFPWGTNTLSLNVLFPALVPAGIVFTLLFAWPWIEAWLTKDTKVHNLLDRPRNAPFRTGVGVAGVIFYCTMWAAASSDLIATHFMVSLNDVTYWLRFLVIFGPLIGFAVARRICLALQRKDREIVLHGVESGRIVRLPHGEYIEVHEPVDEFKRYKLVDFTSPEVTPAQPDARGKVSGKEKLRGRLSRFFFEDRVAPVTPRELEAAHHHESPAEVEADTEDQASITNR